MKIMAIIYHNQDSGVESYGYIIWQSLKELFYIYLNDCDVRNVYHHLKELSDLALIERTDSPQIDADKKCYYTMTGKGLEMKGRYSHYLDILEKSTRVLRKY